MHSSFSHHEKFHNSTRQGATHFQVPSNISRSASDSSTSEMPEMPLSVEPHKTSIGKNLPNRRAGVKFHANNFGGKKPMPQEGWLFQKNNTGWFKLTANCHVDIHHNPRFLDFQNEQILWCKNTRKNIVHNPLCLSFSLYFGPNSPSNRSNFRSHAEVQWIPFVLMISNLLQRSRLSESPPDRILHAAWPTSQQCGSQILTKQRPAKFWRRNMYHPSAKWFRFVPVAMH